MCCCQVRTWKHVLGHLSSRTLIPSITSYLPEWREHERYTKPILFSNSKTSDAEPWKDMEDHQIKWIISERCQSKMLHTMSCVTFQNQQNNACQALRISGRLKTQSIEDFYSSKSMSCDAVLVDICHYRYFPMHYTNRKWTLMYTRDLEW